MGVATAEGCPFSDRDSVEVNFFTFFLKECHFSSPVYGCSTSGIVSLAHIFTGAGQLPKPPLNVQKGAKHEPESSFFSSHIM